MMMLSVMLLMMDGGMTETMRTMMIISMMDGGLIENMDVCSNIALPLTYHHRTDIGKSEIDERCDLLLRDLGISQLNKPGLRPVGLNREERMYVSLARALVNAPFLLLLDDPAAGLSPGCASQLSDACFRYHPEFPTRPYARPPSQRPLTRVTTTSDIGRYLPFGDRFVVLHEQQLHEVGDRDAVAGSAEAHVKVLFSQMLTKGSAEAESDLPPVAPSEVQA